ncbi:MAG: TetR/AcrR family transcriptional regulator [Chitinophagaceae bacterium]
MNEQKQHIIEIAFAQFRQYGFKNITMDDISRSAGVSKKTLYELFSDKDELVLESVKFMLNQNQCETDLAMTASKHAVEQIVHVLNLMEKMVRGLNMVCYMDLQRHYSDAFRYLQEHKESYLYRCIADNLKRGIQEGLYREDIDVEIITRFRMESALLAFQYNVFPQEKYDTVKVNFQIFTNYMYGIASLKGHKLITQYLQKYVKA